MSRRNAQLTASGAAFDLWQILGERRERPAALPLPVLLAEYDEWLIHRRNTPWRRHCASLRLEWDRATDALGRHLVKVLGDSLTRAVEVVHTLTGEGGGSLDDRLSAKATVAVLRQAATAPSAVGASWDDLTEASRHTTAVGFRTVRMAREQFESLATLAGHDCKQIVATLQGILNDDAMSVAEARSLTGQGKLPTAWRDLLHQEAGLTDDERIALCRQVMSTPAHEGRCVAWIAFANARLSSFYLNAGPVVLLDARWAIPNASSDTGQSFVGKTELREIAQARAMLDNDKLTNVVLARVDLGVRSPAGAVNQAVEAVEVVVDAAALEERTGWRQFGWHLLFVDGRLRSQTSIDPEFALGSWPDGLGMDRTADRVAALAPRMASLVATGPVPHDLREAIRSAAEAKTADVRSRIVLYHRVLEAVSAFAHLEDPWRIGRYVAAAWPMASWRAEALSAVTTCLSVTRWAEERKVPDDLLALRQHRGSGLQFSVDIKGAAEQADRLAELATSGFERSWIEETLGAARDAGVMHAALVTLRADARLLESRFRRTRNALVHGSPATRAVCETVDPFASFVAHTALHEALEAYMDGHDLLTTIEGKYQVAQRQERELRDGKSLLDVWQGAAP